jgi:hypothetical protein
VALQQTKAVASELLHLKCGKGAVGITEADASSRKASTAAGFTDWGIAAKQIIEGSPTAPALADRKT